MNEGEKAPVEGRLIYRGIDINDLVGGCVSENRFGFEETAWLLLFGSLPVRSSSRSSPKSSPPTGNCPNTSRRT